MAPKTKLLIARYLWAQSKNRKRVLDELQKSGFAFDDTFRMGSSDLVVDRKARQIAFQNWHALMIQKQDFYVPADERKYTTMRQAHSF
jgi:hypothetical protein